MSYIVNIPDIPEISPQEVDQRINEYRKYLGSIRERLPKGALSYALAPWHYNWNDSQSPHNAWLQEVRVHVPSSGKRSEIRGCNIFVRLLGSYHNGYVELHYKNVRSYSLAQVSEWRYDEIRLSKEGYVVHEIRFDADSRWFIECEDFFYDWKPFHWESTLNVGARNQLLRESKVLRGHDRAVTAVTFSPDSRVLTSSDEGSVLFWDAHSGRQMHVLNSAPATLLARSPDGKLLATVHSSDEFSGIHLWDADTNQLLATLPAENTMNTIQEINFSPDSLTLATAEHFPSWQGSFGRIRLWKLHTPNIQHTLLGMWSVTFAPDSSIIAGVGHTGKATFKGSDIKLWAVTSGQEQSTFTTSSPLLYQVAFSPDGAKIAAMGRDYAGPPVGRHLIVIWDIQTNQEERRFRTPYNINKIAWDPDGRLLASAGETALGNPEDGVQGWLTIWDADSGQDLQTRISHQGSISSLAFSPSGELLATGGSDGTVKVWRVGKASKST
jgi:WD40 repeat protein